MKKLLVLFIVTFAAQSQGARLLPADNKSLDSYLLTLRPGESVALHVDRVAYSSCWHKFKYEALQNKSNVVVLREPLYHPMVVCSTPRVMTGGITIDISNEITTQKKYVTVYAPKGSKVEVETIGQ